MRKKEEFEEVILEAFDMDNLLNFLQSLGFQIVVLSHATLLDLSEIYEFGLLLQDEPVGAVRIHFIDNHYWPRDELPSGEEKVARLMKPSEWNVIVDPVIVVMEKSPKVPPEIILDVRNYRDSLPADPQARKAYEQYLSGRSEEYD
jgi:hypothetical protein